MKRILLLALLLISSFGFGQEAVIVWEKSFGGSSIDQAESIEQTTDGGYIVVGISRSIDGDVSGNNGGSDCWIVKLDLTGNIEWQKSLGSSGFDGAYSIQQTTDEGYIFVGESGNADGDVTSNNGSKDYWIVKLDINGDIVWQKSLGGSFGDNAYTVQQTLDGGYIVSGKTSSNDGDLSGNHGGWDIWTIKFDSLGNIIWQKLFGGSGNDIAESIIQTLDGGYVIAGTSNSSDFDVSGNQGGNDYWIVRLDNMGNIIWEKSLGGSESDHAFSIIQTSDGGFTLCGFSFSDDGDVTNNNSIPGFADFWIVKLDETGNLIWQNALGGIFDEWASSIKQTTDGGYIVTGYSESDQGDLTENKGGVDYWITKLDTAGNLSWQKSMGGSGDDYAKSIIQTNEGEYVISGYSESNDGDVSGNNGNKDAWIFSLNMSNVYGSVFNDVNETCNLESFESGISGIQVSISPGNYIAEVNSNGLWYMDSLPNGNYTATIDTTNLNWIPTCSISQSFTVIDSQVETDGPDFGFISPNPCSNPNISIHSPFLRRCFSDQVVYVQACNEITATSALNSAYTDVKLDSLMTPNSSSIPYTPLGDDVYRFQLGTINPGQCIDFTINTTISCDAILGETLCMDAKLYPVDSCALDSIPTNPLPPNYGNDPNLIMPQPCGLPWDRSSLQVEGWCQGDSVQFSITNTGVFGYGDMDCYSPVLLYVNDTLVNIDSIQLQGQETVYYSYPANGETWILEAEQHPLHPGNSHPNAHVELCGSDSTQWISDLVNNRPLDDADPIDDIYCGIISGSYDPNDKRGFPKGMTSQHHILPNQQLQYVIRFQNTGTDTAFTVVIRDTLDTALNIFTANSGVSSHDYTFRKYGPRLLEWTFDDIMLPDSTTDEPGSNGFVTFTVDQVPNLPNGTLINNQADIYFDFNAPIITNETDHLINDMVEGESKIDLLQQSIATCSSYNWSVTGQTYTQSGTYTEVLTNQAGFDSTLILDLTIYQPNTISEFVSTCNNDYTWSTNGQTYITSGQYTEVLTNQVGCDSTVTLNLTINQPSSGSETIATCGSYTWSANGQSYTQSGQYTEVLTNQVGCDSTVTLNLTINQPSSGSETIATCGSYTWSTNGQSYTQSGQYTEVLTNQVGCDSTVTLNLTINQLSSGSETITSCGSYTWSTNGQSYTQSGQYTEILTNQYGCDSTVTLDLTIDTVNNLITQIDDITLEADASNAQYQWVNCDQNYQAIPGETNQTFEASSNGNYAVIVTENGCTDTTDCVTISNVGLKDFEREALNIYPNPTTKTFTISSENTIHSAFKVVSAEGKEVLSGKMNGKEQTVDISGLSKGVYSVVFDKSELPVLSVIKE